MLMVTEKRRERTRGQRKKREGPPCINTSSQQTNVTHTNIRSLSLSHSHFFVSMIAIQYSTDPHICTYGANKTVDRWKFPFIISHEHWLSLSKFPANWSHYWHLLTVSLSNDFSSRVNGTNFAGNAIKKVTMKSNVRRVFCHSTNAAYKIRFGIKVIGSVRNARQLRRRNQGELVLI